LLINLFILKQKIKIQTNMTFSQNIIIVDFYSHRND
jgi:hypothetical protein